MKRSEKKTCIPINADVYCSDGRSGTSLMAIINPVTQILTHPVVAYGAVKSTLADQALVRLAFPGYGSGRWSDCEQAISKFS